MFARPAAARGDRVFFGCLLTMALAACAPTPNPPQPPPTEAPRTATATAVPPATATPTRTLRPTRAPTPTATQTSAPLSVPTAPLPPQPALRLPEGFSVEVFELRPGINPADPFQPVAASGDAVLERHRAQRELEWLGGVDYTIEIDGQATGYLGSERIVVTVDDPIIDGVFNNVLEVRIGDRLVYRGEPEPRGPGLLNSLWIDGSHWYVQLTHTRVIRNVEVELVSDVLRDGQSLSAVYGYDEVFGFQLIAGRPFFFHRVGDAYGLMWDGAEIPLPYTAIVHNLCCGGGPRNPMASLDMTSFFALQNDTWYYVEAGMFEPPDGPTATPDVSSAADVFPVAWPASGRVWRAEQPLCPSLNGILQAPLLQRDEAQAILTRFAQLDGEAARSGADTAFWERLAAAGRDGYSVPLAQIRVDYAGVSPYADPLRTQCGDMTMRLSQWVELCSRECSALAQDPSASVTDVYLINRFGHWLVWATYP